MDERTPICDMESFDDDRKEGGYMRSCWDFHENARQVVNEMAHLRSHSGDGRLSKLLASGHMDMAWQ